MMIFGRDWILLHPAAQVVSSYPQCTNYTRLIKLPQPLHCQKKGIEYTHYLVIYDSVWVVAGNKDFKCSS